MYTGLILSADKQSYNFACPVIVIQVMHMRICCIYTTYSHMHYLDDNLLTLCMCAGVHV